MFYSLIYSLYKDGSRVRSVVCSLSPSRVWLQYTAQILPRHLLYTINQTKKYDHKESGSSTSYSLYLKQR